MSNSGLFMTCTALAALTDGYAASCNLYMVSQKWNTTQSKINRFKLHLRNFGNRFVLFEDELFWNFLCSLFTKQITLYGWSSVPYLLGGVAQWLGRWSLAGRISWSMCLICGWHVTTSWVECPLWVNQPGQLSLPSLLGRWMRSNPRKCMD